MEVTRRQILKGVVFGAAAALVGPQIAFSKETTFSFKGQSLGKAAPDRRIVACAGNGEGNAITSVTVNGKSATMLQIAKHKHGATEMWSVDCPQGVIGELEIVYDADVSKCALGVYSVYDGGEAPPEMRYEGQVLLGRSVPIETV